MTENSWPAELFAAADLVTPMTIRVAATLRLADHVGDGVSTVDGLVERTGARRDPLARVLAHLATVGVFSDNGEGGYRLGPLGERLRSSDAGGGRDWLDIWGAVGRADLALLRLLETTLTGRPGYPLVYGAGFWEDLAADAELSASFDALMGAQLHVDVSDLIAAYDWSALSRVVDVGGGNGALLTMILHRYRHLRGTVVELPGPAEAARTALLEHGLGERSEVVVGSFFDGLPAGADAYVLSGVLHDWNDDDARRVLSRCADAAGVIGRVLVIEGLQSGSADVPPRTSMDLRMLAYFAGRERTLEQINGLAHSVGLAVAAMHSVGHRSLIDLRPAATAT